MPDKTPKYSLQLYCILFTLLLHRDKRSFIHCKQTFHIYLLNYYYYCYHYLLQRATKWLEIVDTTKGCTTVRLYK